MKFKYFVRGAHEPAMDGYVLDHIPRPDECISFEDLDQRDYSFVVHHVQYKLSRVHGSSCEIHFYHVKDLVFRHDRELLRRLDRIETLLKEQAIIMTDVNQQVLDLTAAFDAETTAVAARLDKLVAQAAADALANAGTIKPETLAALAAVSDRLKLLGADPVVPIPAPVVEPPAPPAV